MESSQFSDSQSRYETIEQMDTQGATCDTYRVKLYGKMHFLKQLRPEYVGDIRYQEALRKEFETGYRLEHPNLVRYLSLDKDSVLMEYVDGETLSQRLTKNPDYFKQRKNADKFVRQLLDALGYLHSHQVLHLDLKPDNILLTYINDDVKLIDLGFCRTDVFVDIYNKVIARCTAENPSDRYKSVDEVLHVISHQRRFFHWVALIVLLAALFAAGLTLLIHQKNESAVIEEVVVDSVDSEKHDTLQHIAPPPVSKPNLQPPAKDEQTLLKEEMERMIDKAYRSTIATFCDSVFPSPSPSTGKAWSEASTEFHNQTIQIGNRLSKKHPNTPESTIRQDVESRFQSLVTSVFNQMRTNAQQ